jgi:hypothetical protein
MLTKDQCLRGHDTRSPNSRRKSGGCRECRRARDKRYKARYRSSPEGIAHERAYEQQPSRRGRQNYSRLKRRVAQRINDKRIKIAELERELHDTKIASGVRTI